LSSRSALYVGHVAHHRLSPKRHALRHRVYWLLLDLDELPELAARLRLFSHNGANLISLQDRDHGDRSGTPLREQAFGHLSAAGLDVAGVSVRLLCMPRVAGYDFNPLSVYYCSDASGRSIAMIYEVNNTYGGRHTYVIPISGHRAQLGKTVRQSCNKEFYVSPFMDLDVTYRFQADLPGNDVSLSVEARKNDRTVINTSLHGQRRDLTDFNILRLTVTHPVLPAKVTGAIYWHALKLWWRGFAVNQTAPSTANTVTIVRPNE
jgi:DUF1365 family protein